jgi:hypothetical protein
MLAFDAKFSVTPEGALFRATHATERVKFCATVECLKFLGSLQETPDQATLEKIYTSHRSAIEIAAGLLYDRMGAAAPRDSQGRILVGPGDMAAT